MYKNAVTQILSISATTITQSNWLALLVYVLYVRWVFHLLLLSFTYDSENEERYGVSISQFDSLLVLCCFFSCNNSTR